MKTLPTISLSRFPRQLAMQLSTALLASLLLTMMGQAMAQNAGGKARTDTQQSSDLAVSAQTDKSRQDEADQAARKPDDRSPSQKAGKRGSSKDDQAPERELEEEEDI